ncbi:zinc metalloproteinase nas-36-like [Liolophura sinensis]|uniref:zinc metalloproteinase nas-36-like n=1 Tax=Liolophura sinensis TaxID=3198878 RepID=UPI003158C757
MTQLPCSLLQLRWSRYGGPHLLHISLSNTPEPPIVTDSVSELPNPELEKYWIKRSMTEWERYTCLRFTPRTTTQRNYIRFVNGSGCNSRVGMVFGGQVINLKKSGCRQMSTYIHEIGHAIGLRHEHQRPDRDNFITINYTNIMPSYRRWFTKYSRFAVNTYNVKYDHWSIMHYGLRAFSKDRKSQTIKAKTPYKDSDIEDNVFNDLSFGDVKIVNLMYSCAARCKQSVRCSGEGYVDENCRCVCPDGTSNCQVNQGNPVSKPAVPAPTCINRYKDWACAIWANQGECWRYKYRASVKTYCRRTCGVCGSKQAAAGDTAGTCQNDFPDDKCKTWQLRGDCLTNRAWMNNHCKKACDYCNGVSDAKKACTNVLSDSQCLYYTWTGKCAYDRNYMWTNCRQACFMCGEESQNNETKSLPPCKNGFSDNLCDQMARASPSWCTRAGASWVKKKCRKSCNFCQKTSEEAQVVPCEDKNKYCTTWANKSYCDNRNYAMYMLRVCRKACNNCAANCQDMSHQCAAWGRAGRCAKDVSFMFKNCQKTCRVCRK